MSGDKQNNQNSSDIEHQNRQAKNPEELDLNTIFKQQMASNLKSNYNFNAIAGDPTPIGLLCFGMTTIMLAFVQTGWSEMGFTAHVICYAFFYGGLTQLIAGILEIIRGNTFGGTIFSQYGCFWLGYGLFTVLEEQGLFQGMSPVGLTLFYVQWTVLTFFFFAVSFKARSWAMRAVLGLLTLAFLCLACGELGGQRVTFAGGYFAFFSGLSACYYAFGIMIYDEAKFRIPGV